MLLAIPRVSPDSGQAHDLEGPDAFLPCMVKAAVLADKAYDADERLRKKLVDKGRQVLIPSKKNRFIPIDDDKHLYKAPHLIENFFAKLKQYRAIVTRYDKTSINFLGAIHLASSIVWLN